MAIEANEWVFWEPALTDEVDEQVDLALEIRDSGDCELAIDLLRAFVMRCPNHIDVMH